jgi:hypothetical protein
MMADEVFGEVASGIFRLVWGDTSLINGIREGNERVHAKVMSVLQYKAPAVENYMKTNAPWQDQTGNARQGLRAEAFDEGSNMGIVLYHQAPYGIWLEIKNSGEYAIIDPTLQVMGPEVMRSLENILGSI